MPRPSRSVSGTMNSPAVAEAFLLQQRAEIGADFGFRLRRHAVQDHGHHDVPRGRVQEQLPGNRVCIAVGRGDEDPEVRGGQQLSGQPAVVIGDGIDVGCVQQRDPLRDRLVRHKDE